MGLVAKFASHDSNDSANFPSFHIDVRQWLVSVLHNLATTCSALKSVAKSFKPWPFKSPVKQALNASIWQPSEV